MKEGVILLKNLDTKDIAKMGVNRHNAYIDAQNTDPVIRKEMSDWSGLCSIDINNLLLG